MGTFNRVWPVKGPYKSLFSFRMCMESFKLDCYEGGTGAGEFYFSLRLCGDNALLFIVLIVFQLRWDYSSFHRSSNLLFGDVL